LTTDAFSSASRIKKNQEIIAGLHVYRAKNFSNDLVWKFHLVTPLTLPKKIKINSYDVIHLHEVRCWLHWLVLAQVNSKAKVVISPWGTLLDNGRYVWIKKLIDIVFIRILRSRVDLSLAQTVHEQKVLKLARVGKQLKIVPLGISAADFKNLPSQKLARQKLKLPDQKNIYVYLGRFSSTKGLDLLIRAFAQLPNPEKNLLVLVGRDDGYLTQMKILIKQLQLEQFVKILPPLYDRERFLAYRAADVFVSTPTVYEETSTTCLEALACGRPVLTTHQAEIPFLNPQDGVYYAQPQVSSIRRQMKNLANFSQKINKNKLSKFTWSQIAQQLYVN